MNERKRRSAGWIFRAAIGIALGLIIGLVVGWQVWPVQYRNTTPDVLRRDYRDDYVVMVATAYGINGDLERAQKRLELLAPQDSAAPVVELAERLIETDGSERDIVYLTHLAASLDALTPTLIQHMESHR